MSVTAYCRLPTECGGPGWIRTSEGVSQQIYSLPRLATSVPTHDDHCYQSQHAALYARRAGLSNDNGGRSHAIIVHLTRSLILAACDYKMEQQPQAIATAGDTWAAAQRARRKPLATNTIVSYCDAWASFSAWAARTVR